jgi:hypothetical protein
MKEFSVLLPSRTTLFKQLKPKKVTLFEISTSPSVFSMDHDVSLDVTLVAFNRVFSQRPEEQKTL